MQSLVEPRRRYCRQEILESEGNEPATRYSVRAETDDLRADIDESIASMKRWIAGTGVAVAVVVLLAIGALIGSGVFLAHVVLVGIGIVGALVAVSSAPFG